MDIAEKDKQTIVRLCLNGSTLQTICRVTRLEEDDVVDVLLRNEVTNKLAVFEAEKAKSGEYAAFFYKSEYGRQKLPDKQRRKLRQIRISDEEMEYLGNPSTTQMRETMLAMKAIQKFCNFLDEKGIELIPDEWLEKEYPKHMSQGLGAMYQKHYYNNTYNKLRILATTEKTWNDVEK